MGSSWSQGVTDEPLDPGTATPAPAGPGVWRGQGAVVGAVAVGGGIGATARYGASLLWPTPAAAFPWTTLLVNTVGCALIGLLLVLVDEVWGAHRLLRPFFGTGVLGGFTTFSTYAVDFKRLLDAGRAATGLLYLAGTLLAAMAAVWAGVVATRRALAFGGYGRGPR
ncbi:fluoride efflux transporter CrcB [Streptomyces coffeae]|uniref:Fluoride-specific ion channel FluC n=1 Tax=Streptomyces coffeae TaxID=621382 RepID=A0ABS1NDE7_9ACTN|nr:fluoride efflux transporter CrcB [Streptomyces coffeae]MBL1098088.1 fluoride efflux transporter CrcB [Streptomyces coffeae]